VALFLLSFTIAPLQSVVFGHQTARAPDALQGRVHSAVNLICGGLAPLSPAAVGLVSERWGAGVLGGLLTAAAAVVMCCASASASLRGFRSADSRPG
jgi:hypothetical protein